MSTVEAWLDDTDLDWSRAGTVRTVRSRARQPSTAQRRRARAAVVVFAAALAAGLALTDFKRERTAPAPPPLTVADKVAHHSRPAPATLGAIARCESRGDPTAVSGDGRYRGKFQFDQATWESVGGRGDPALAPEREQNRRARVLAAERGSRPWPVCAPAVAGH
jgi:hypothetical protein